MAEDESTVEFCKRQYMMSWNKMMAAYPIPTTNGGGRDEEDFMGEIEHLQEYLKPYIMVYNRVKG